MTMSVMLTWGNIIDWLVTAFALGAIAGIVATWLVMRDE